ncbi:MAG: TonB-dependent receptor [Bacteroidales bacterium]|nr:TonB-dependent receptor [Bacteroidales bacterium]
MLQTVKGRVVDDVSEQPLVGVGVVVNQNGYLSTYTDIDGYYSVPNVPVGRITILFSSIGMETIYMENLSLNSGKELVINIKMREDVLTVEEIVITAERDKLRPVNDMASVSARTFSVADAERYAGAMNDISRMAQNFAGVGTPSDSSNDIVIRGNSPFGLLWRMEGVDIYNPNHFADGGATGGAISMLNVNTLSNSDFYTSAFPAEYTNAYSGVFDIHLREGNYDIHEFTGQIGINGLEFGVEGPLSKNWKASYLASYRYSFLDILSYMGFDFGTGSAVPRYQDWTAKIHVPTPKSGTFSFFSIGGTGKVSIVDGESDFYNYADDIASQSQMAVAGIQYNKTLGHNQSLKISLATSYSSFSAEIDSLTIETNQKDRSQDAMLMREFQTLQAVHNVKLGSRLSIRSGLAGKRLAYGFISNDYSKTTYPKDVNEIGHTFLLQAYSEISYRASARLTLDAGVNAQFLFLNQTWNVDPRVGLSWKFKDKQELTLGYGLHSQYQGLEIYMTKLFSQAVDSKIYPNKFLDMTRSHHTVAGYQIRLSPSTRFKAEAYFQYLYNIPVDLYEPYYSVINLGGMNFDKYGRVYVSDATGYNYGIELTLERFLSQGWYYMATASLFESKFRSIDNILRNTRYNSNYIVNLLIGKEFDIKRTTKSGNMWSLGGDLKATFAGGQRYIPVDLEASKQEKAAVYLFEEAYEPRQPFYMRGDIKVWAKIHQRKITHEIGIEVRNFTNRKNVYSYEYDVRMEAMRTSYQTGLLPLGYYRITF